MSKYLIIFASDNGYYVNIAPIKFLIRLRIKDFYKKCIGPIPQLNTKPDTKPKLNEQDKKKNRTRMIFILHIPVIDTFNNTHTLGANP